MNSMRLYYREKANREYLKRNGELRHARSFLRRNAIPNTWEGTPLEYAIRHMPHGFLARLKIFLGID